AARAARAHPVDELDTLLEGRVAFAQEAGLVEADGRERAADRGEGALSDADDADVARFHERDARAAGQRAERLREEGGGEPTGGAAADDEDVLGRIHLVSALSIKPIS